MYIDRRAGYRRERGTASDKKAKKKVKVEEIARLTKLGLKDIMEEVRPLEDV